jgi:RimJ/RimL family protein N-acetyltransferase
MILIETERLLLRMFTKDDLDAYASMCADAEVMRYVGAGNALSRADAWRHLAMFLGTWQLRGYGNFAVQDKASGQMIGRVGYFHPEGWPGIEMGWALARPFWGRGLATEAARACLQQGFSQFGFTHVLVFIQPEHQRSIKVAERLGARQEGTIEMFGKTALTYGIRNDT